MNEEKKQQKKYKNMLMQQKLRLQFFKEGFIPFGFTKSTHPAAPDVSCVTITLFNFMISLVYLKK